MNFIHLIIHMNKFVLFTLFTIFANNIFAATEISLDSPLINLSLPEIELNDPEIYHGNPCANIQSASSCFNDTPNKQVIVNYPLTITSNIPSGVIGNLTFSFIDQNSTPFAEINLIQLGNVLSSPLQFTTSRTQSYQIQFKIKYLGTDSHPEPKVKIRFTLVEETI